MGNTAGTLEWRVGKAGEEKKKYFFIDFKPVWNFEPQSLLFIHFQASVKERLGPFNPQYNQFVDFCGYLECHSYLEQGLEFLQ